VKHLVFVDIETTGLGHDQHEIVELAWALTDGPVNVVRPRHTLRGADPVALRVNRYHERGLGDPDTWSTPDEVSQFLLDARGATLVAANPHFDASFLAAHFGHAPWHYRLFDIQVYAAAVFDWDTPPSLREIRAELTERGHELSEPDHTAAADVTALREAHRALRAERLQLSLAA
jgi:DNA polymerase III epsilon subunit-like protein